MKFENVSEADKKKIIGRCVSSVLDECEDVQSLHDHAKALEDALVQSVLNRTNQRRELQRLNQQVRHINEVSLANSVLVQEVVALNTLLDRDEEENRDTDPSQLVALNNIVDPHPEDAKYAEWDMRTRYPGNQPRRPTYG